MNYANIKPLDVANAPGISSSIFFSGCKFHCKDCFNQVAWDFNYGNPYTKDIEDLFIKYLKNPHVKNACLLGGEVFQQDLGIILNLVKRIKKETDVQIWVWSGYIFDNLLTNDSSKQILEYIDVLVDGQFQIENKNLKLKYRGSSNQRIINVKASLKENKVILLEKE